jgi:hypothetical protein
MRNTWGWTVAAILLTAAIANAADDAVDDPGELLKSAWARLDAGDAHSALLSASSIPADPSTCQWLLLRSLAHEKRGDLELAKAGIAIYFDLGCTVGDRQAQAVGAFTRIALAIRPAPQQTAKPSLPTSDYFNAPQDDDEPDDWSEREIRTDGRLRVLDARAVVQDKTDFDYYIIFEILVQGADPDTRVELRFNPPGASWVDARMRAKKPGYYRVRILLKQFGSTYWKIVVEPRNLDAEVITTKTLVLKVR